MSKGSSFAYSRPKGKEGVERKRTLESLLAHTGIGTGHAGKSNEPLSPPLELTSTYRRPVASEEQEHYNRIYARTHNSTRELLEKSIAQLEFHSTEKSNTPTNVESSVAFSSGMAAVSAVLTAASSSSPLHVLLPNDIYHGVPSLLQSSLLSSSITFTSIDMTSLQEVRHALQNLDQKNVNNIVVWMETPSNPHCQVTDIVAVCDLIQDMKCRKNEENDKKIFTVVDSTWSPPCITQPLQLGADVVLHSGTKYLGGHSDVLLGLVTCSPMNLDLNDRIRQAQIFLGAVASPLDCWLTLRGMRTLHLRMDRACNNALSVAQFLHSHPSVQKVFYPGLPTHPQHDIAKKQMNGKGGAMLSFLMKDKGAAIKVSDNVQLIQRATSLGGTETLIEHRASIEPPDRTTTPDNLLRLSVGLEDTDDIIQDLERAIETASSPSK